LAFAQYPSSLFEDGTYLRFRELSMTYTFPRLWSRLIRVANLSLTGAIRNLALWTRYSGPDPEVSNTQGLNAQYQFVSSTFSPNSDIRQDGATVPLARYLVLRLNAGF
jgi:hypothetical protein